MKPGTQITLKNLKKLIGKNFLLVSDLQDGSSYRSDTLLRYFHSDGRVDLLLRPGYWDPSQFNSSCSEGALASLANDMKYYDKYEHVLVELL